MPLFRAIPPSSKSMASGRNGGKEGAAEASDMGKGNRYDMGKGWHLVPKQPSLPPPLRAEAHQREATKERMTQIAVSKGKGTNHLGKLLEQVREEIRSGSDTEAWLSSQYKLVPR